ncbi:hypothetical protein RHSIM_Rhsim06G0242100 [Rhododendron simsii]|uniref:rRNA methylase YtqB n=1 Tax=Rhododendron simsii TaxID=118357 RepID=A0A834GRS7_RHOSS|nr:hypothetical protein RHSIM_Rhsim06G0242100 [Rhododendron simsii]
MMVVVVGFRFYYPHSNSSCRSRSMLLSIRKLQGRRTFTRFFPCSSSSKTNNYFPSPHTHLSFSSKSAEPNRLNDSTLEDPSTSLPKDSPFPGLEDVMMGYIFGKKKATEVAHSVWRHIVQNGDILVDATCGNGYDTLAMVKMVADKPSTGRVYAMDIQKAALESTSYLLDESLDSDELVFGCPKDAKYMIVMRICMPNLSGITSHSGGKGLVELFAICHSRMEEVVPKGIPVRLVAFNLGYLPGGDKATITKSETTLQALEAAKRMLAPGGLISLVVYVGHPGGREEYEAVQAFASGLPVENWICCKLQMLNRSSAPILVLLLNR